LEGEVASKYDASAATRSREEEPDLKQTPRRMINRSTGVPL
jgi:hypothetical protein